MKSVLKKKEKPLNKEDVITSNIFGPKSYLNNKLMVRKFIVIV